MSRRDGRRQRANPATAAAAASAPAVPAVPELRPLACVAVLAAALAILLHDSLFGGKGLVPADGIYDYLPWAKTAAIKPTNYLLADQFTSFVPFRQFFHDELLKGRFPLWNPHLSCGLPSLAAMQGAALYPLNLLLSPLSPFVASGIAAFTKLIAAGLFTGLYLRRLGTGNAAALIGGLTFALSGFLIVWLGHPHVNAAVMLPVLFYFVEGSISQPRAMRSWIGVATAFAVMLLGGHAPTAVHITLAAAAYATFRFVTVRPPIRWILALALAAAAGVLLAAPQLLPFIEYYQLSSSSQSSEALGRWASHLQPATLLHFLLPYLSGSPSVGFEQLPQVLGLGPLDNFNERTGYVGVLALFLALVAVVRRRGSFIWFFAGLALVGLTIIYGVPPWPAIMRELPVMRSINHQRLLLWVDWSAAVLAGLGADTLIRTRPALRPAGLGIAFVAAVVLGLWALWTTSGGFARLDEASSSFLASRAWILAGGLLVIVVVTRRGLGARWVPTLGIAWTAVDLVWFAIGYNPAVPRERYYPATGAIRFLQADTSVFRVLGTSTVLTPNTAGMYGLNDIRGQDFMTLARYEELITGRAGDFFFYQSAGELPPSIKLLNAKYLLVPEILTAASPDFEPVYDGEIGVYRDTTSYNRAMVVFDYRVESDPAALLGRMRDPAFDPASVVWLEQQPDPPVDASPSTSALSAEARIAHYEPDLVTVEAQLPKPGFLLLLDTWFPGWTATVDGRAASLYRADYTFRAVPVPAGTHTITFAYRPISFRLGLGVSLATMGLLAWLWFRDRRGSRT